MKRKIKFINDNIQRFNKNTAEFLNGRYLYAWICEIYCALRFGCSPDDFFRYKFYEKSNFERNKFITYRRSKKIIKTYNDKSECNIFRDKVEFNKKFGAFLGREWLNLETATQEEFDRFVMKHRTVMIKPVRGGQGKGIFKLVYDTANKNESVENFRDCIAEEFLIQHEIISKINCTSVNTVRILTFKGEIIACALRTGGAGAVVDNLHSNGVCAHIDIETGIIDAMAIDMSLKSYISHPDSKEKIVGLQIPNWTDLKIFMQQVVSVVPEVKYVGWDVAVLKDGFAIIEGNHDPGHDVVQMIAQTGLYEKIKNS